MIPKLTLDEMLEIGSRVASWERLPDENRHSGGYDSSDSYQSESWIAVSYIGGLQCFTVKVSRDNAYIIEVTSRKFNLGKYRESSGPVWVSESHERLIALYTSIDKEYTRSKRAKERAQEIKEEQEKTRIQKEKEDEVEPLVRLARELLKK